MSLAERKAAHINICCDEDLPIEGGATFFDHIEFLHHSLPEIDYDSISTDCSFLGHNLRAPFMISCMTGGSADGYRLNKILARAASEEGIAVGTGSLRILLKKPEVMEHFRLKEFARGVPVLGNIGAVQLPELFAGSAGLLQHFFAIVDDLELDGLVVHLNPGQEIFQRDGDRNFSGLLDHIARLCDRSRLPIVVKETGAGIAPQEAEWLFRAGVKYVDVAGAGGSNWIAVEWFRENQPERGLHDLAGFKDWGIPSALALSAALARCRDLLPEDGGFIASGGLRNADDFAKAIALGANMAAAALPFIRIAAKHGLEGCRDYIQKLKLGLRRHMLLTASTDIAALRHAPLLFSRKFDEQLHALQRAADLSSRRTPQAPGPAGSAGSAGSRAALLADRKFRKYSIHQRRKNMQSLFPPDELAASGQASHFLDLADAMIESAIGFMPVPLGIVQGCLIDGELRHLAMAVEEPSVLAAANYAMRIIGDHGGFHTRADESIMTASIYLSFEDQADHKDQADQPDGFNFQRVQDAQARIREEENRIEAALAETLGSMTKRGGGYRGVESHWLAEAQSLRVSLKIDVRDAMGANLLNTAAETISPLLEEITGAEKLMAILSNQAGQRRAAAEFALPLSALQRGDYRGEKLAGRIISLCRIADEDPARAVTHNKGIMNGISSLALATANDTRAIEAAAHAWAARSGSYCSLSRYWLEDNMLKGSLELPLALATVGGAVSCHPVAGLSLAIMGQPNARRLARYAAALGLAQNFAALLALASEGIQAGHMKLHAKRQAYSRKA